MLDRGLFVVQHGSGHDCLESPNPIGIEGMSGEEFEGLRGGFPLRELLPERDGGLGIVSRLGHIEGADLIRLVFMLAAVRKHHADGRQPAVGGHPQFAVFHIFAVQGHGQAESDQPDRHGLAHPFAAMSQRGMGDFVPQHGRQFGIVTNVFEQAFVDPDFAAGQTKGVGLVGGEEFEFPFEPRGVHHFADGGTDADHRLGFRFVRAQRLFFLQISPGLGPEGRFLGHGGDKEASPARDGCGGTTAGPAKNDRRQPGGGALTIQDSSQGFHVRLPFGLMPFRAFRAVGEFATGHRWQLPSASGELGAPLPPLAGIVVHAGTFTM